MSPKGSKIGGQKGSKECWEETYEKPQNRRLSRVKTVILEARKVENGQKIRRKVDAEPFEVAYAVGRAQRKTFKTDFGRF